MRGYQKGREAEDRVLGLYMVCVAAGAWKWGWEQDKG